MKKKLVIKPMSFNQAYCGRKFKTKDYLAYEEELLWILKVENIEPIKGFIEVIYNFYIVNYLKSDVGNYEKCLSDILVKSGIIDDDRFIRKITLEKFKSDYNYIEIEIKTYL